MPPIDDIDRAILELLAEDARRPFREIADRVALSPPAVSARVDRLREQGVLQGFTAVLDRDRLRGGSPVLVDLEVDPARVEDVREALAGEDAVEALLVTADARVLSAARPPGDAPGEWVRDVVDPAAVRSLDIRPLASVDWSPAAPVAELSRACDECGNPVTDAGHTATVGGEPHAFCCASCEDRFRERYQELAEGA